MGSLGMLNIAAPPPPLKYFGTVQDQQKKEFLYGRSFCLRPIVRNTSSVSYSCAKHLTRLAGYSLVDRRQFLNGSQVI